MTQSQTILKPFIIQIYNKRVFVAPFQAKSRGLIPTGVKHNNAIVCGEPLEISQFAMP